MRDEAGAVSAMLITGARVFLDDRVVGLVRLGQSPLTGNAALEFIDAVVLAGRHVAFAAGQGKAGASEENRSKNGSHGGSFDNAL